MPESRPKQRRENCETRPGMAAPSGHLKHHSEHQSLLAEPNPFLGICDFSSTSCKTSGAGICGKRNGRKVKAGKAASLTLVSVHNQAARFRTRGNESMIDREGILICGGRTKFRKEASMIRQFIAIGFGLIAASVAEPAEAGGKAVNKSSPALMQSTATGSHYQKATIVTRDVSTGQPTGRRSYGPIKSTR
jgi:hypothetical protein